MTISERGREIARIVPIERAVDLESRLDELARDGSLVRRRRTGRIRTLTERPGALRRFLKERG